MEDTVTVLGVTIRRSPVSRVYKPVCEYLKNGFCEKCTCDKCEGGFLMDELREATKRGDFNFPVRECKCVERARSRHQLKVSGLKYLAERCTFESFRTDKPWQGAIKRRAQEYLAEAKHTSFFISGQSGCGKTHLCTAICNDIIERGGRLRYFQWVRDGTRLKQQVNDWELYERAIGELISVPYLYIDDLFKQEVTAADIRLAYELISGRCNARRPTILSSERDLSFIRDARDGEGEAIAGRIYESCGSGKYCFQLKGKEKDLRFGRG